MVGNLNPTSGLVINGHQALMERIQSGEKHPRSESGHCRRMLQARRIQQGRIALFIVITIRTLLLSVQSCARG